MATSNNNYPPLVHDKDCNYGQCGFQKASQLYQPATRQNPSELNPPLYSPSDNILEIEEREYEILSQKDEEGNLQIFSEEDNHDLAIIPILSKKRNQKHRALKNRIYGQVKKIELLEEMNDTQKRTISNQLFQIARLEAEIINMKDCIVSVSKGLEAPRIRPIAGDPKHVYLERYTNVQTKVEKAAIPGIDWDKIQWGTKDDVLFPKGNLNLQ